MCLQHPLQSCFPTDCSACCSDLLSSLELKILLSSAPVTCKSEDQSGAPSLIQVSGPGTAAAAAVGLLHGCSPHAQEGEGGLFCPTARGFPTDNLLTVDSLWRAGMPAHVHWFINRVGNRKPSLVSFPVRNLFLECFFNLSQIQLSCILSSFCISHS